jgi:UDP-N-acetylmuramoyl-tripeptide--D-alanyl-D-alanine ligase
MEPLRASELAAAVAGLLRGPDSPAAGVSVDTRTLKPGQVYFAIKGRRLDGHRFVEQAVKAGAAGVVVSDEAAAAASGFTVRVADTRHALVDLAAHWRSQLSLKAAAVTGSNGKTTTKEMLAAMLATRYRVVKAEGSFNNDVGVPLTVLRLERTTEAAVFEIEMNEPGGTLALARACRPQVGVVTNVGDTHLESMIDRRGVAAEKAELLQALPADGLAVLNADDPLVMDMGRQHGPKRRVKFGFGAADMVADRVDDLGLEGFCFRLNRGLVVRQPFPGRHNVANFLGAYAAAREFGIGAPEAAAAVRAMESLPLRLRVVRLGRVTLVEDCYNANPQSVQAALAVLEQTGVGASRVVILGDMLELGARARELHEEVGGQVARIADRLVVVGATAESAAGAAVRAGMRVERVHSFASADSVGDALFDIIRDGDTILVKGSRAVGLELISRRIQTHYEEDSSSVH